jgi:hypothetical protein
MADTPVTFIGGPYDEIGIALQSPAEDTMRVPYIADMPTDRPVQPSDIKFAQYQRVINPLTNEPLIDEQGYMHYRYIADTE